MQWWLYQLGRLLSGWRDLGDEESDGPWRRRWRAFTWCLTGGYALAIVTLAGLIAWGLERNVWATALAYLPRWGWLLPLAVLVPLARWGHWSQWLVQAACVGLVCAPGWTWRRGAPPPGTGPAVTIVTLNVGDTSQNPPVTYLRQQAPDLLVLQEAGGPSPKLREAFPDHHLVDAGEFSLWSRFPITTHELVPGPTAKRGMIAARYELAHPDGPVVLYNVHLPTRRDWLIDLAGRGLLAELRDGARSGILSAAHRQAARDSLLAEVAQAQALAARIAAETAPTIVAGDFNALPGGAVHDAFAAHLQEAFAARGSGYGWTVPASTRNLVALRRPWLRVDYVWSNAAWAVERCEREPLGRSSQHLAVTARLRLGAGTR